MKVQEDVLREYFISLRASHIEISKIVDNIKSVNNAGVHVNNELDMIYVYSAAHNMVTIANALDGIHGLGLRQMPIPTRMARATKSGLSPTLVYEGVLSDTQALISKINNEAEKEVKANSKSSFPAILLVLLVLGVSIGALPGIAFVLRLLAVGGLQVLSEVTR